MDYIKSLSKKHSITYHKKETHHGCSSYSVVHAKEQGNAKPHHFVEKGNKHYNSHVHEIQKDLEKDRQNIILKRVRQLIND